MTLQAIDWLAFVTYVLVIACATSLQTRKPKSSEDYSLAPAQSRKAQKIGSPSTRWALATRSGFSALQPMRSGVSGSPVTR
jgi:hypothetical protein